MLMSCMQDKTCLACKAAPVLLACLPLDHAIIYIISYVVHTYVCIVYVYAAMSIFIFVYTHAYELYMYVCISIYK
jgi:hypothetical protein